MRRSSAENPSYHRSKLIKSFTVENSKLPTRLDYFGSSYLTLLKSKVTRFNTYILKQGDRLDLLSYKAYQNTSLWWLLFAYNTNLHHPLNLPPGEAIKIPLKEDVDSFLLAYKSGEVNAAAGAVEV
jgi:hypothetical protein